jgi:predicted membrane-bound spermidine synthase
MPLPADGSGHRPPTDVTWDAARTAALGRPRPAVLDVALFLLFFSSGFVALLYQVIWQRLLGLIAGLDLYAVTLIVAVYMLGMGLGSYAGGVLADRVAPRRLLVAFALAELVVAVFALASTTLYHGVFFAWAAELGPRSTLGAIAAAATLVVPTFFMGLTLPVLSKALTPSLEMAAHKIAGLYGWNTIGAACGAWLGSAILVRTLGYERSLWVGAAVNLGCAAGALLLVRMIRAPAAGASSRAGAGGGLDQTVHAGWSWRTWLVVYFLSGFLALGLEMVWFRLLGVLLKSTAYTFPLLLSLYLFGVGIGSLAGRRLARRTRRPLAWFLLAQAAITLYAGLSVRALVWAIGSQSGLESVRRYLASYEPIEFAFDFFALSPSQTAFYLGLPALLILPPTLLMGVSFPLLQRGAHSDLEALGRRVGMLQTANIFGSTSGVILVGLWLIDGFGTAGTLRILTLGSLVFLLLAVAAAARPAARAVRAVAVAGAIAVPAGSAWLVPSSELLWARLHGVRPAQLIYAEDGTGLTVLTNEDPAFQRRTGVYVNGLGQSWVPFSGVHSYLGLVPVLLHPDPKRIAIIGLGSGDTVYSAAGRSETERIDCIEIIGGQIETLRTLYTRNGYEGLGRLLEDPRVRFIVGDGRRFVMQSREGYDIIEADALRPASAYAGTLYSIEYFELMRSRLAPGGLAVTWAPTARVYATFADVFPHVAVIEPMLIGSNEPIVLDADAVRERAQEPRTVDHYRRAGIDLDEHVRTFLRTFRNPPQPSSPAPDELLNTDLFPRDELRAR